MSHLFNSTLAFGCEYENFFFKMRMMDVREVTSRLWFLCYAGSHSEVLLIFRKSINKGIGVDNLHYLNDGLWKVSSDYILKFRFFIFLT